MTKQVSQQLAEAVDACHAARKAYDAALALPLTEHKVDSALVKRTGLALVKAWEAYDKAGGK